MSAFELYSPLTPGDCIARLAAATDPEGFLASISGSKPAIGYFRGPEIQLRKRLGFGRHNSFQTYLTGVFEAHGSACVLRGRAGLHYAVAPVLGIGLGLIGLVLIGGLVAAVRRWNAGTGQIAGLFIPLGMAAFVFVLLRFGQWMARKEERFLLAFIAEVIEAGNQPEPTVTG